MLVLVLGDGEVALVVELGNPLSKQRITKEVEQDSRDAQEHILDVQEHTLDAQEHILGQKDEDEKGNDDEVEHQSVLSSKGRGGHETRSCESWETPRTTISYGVQFFDTLKKFIYNI